MIFLFIVVSIMPRMKYIVSYYRFTQKLENYLAKSANVTVIIFIFGEKILYVNNKTIYLERNNCI